MLNTSNFVFIVFALICELNFVLIINVIYDLSVFSSEGVFLQCQDGYCVIVFDFCILVWSVSLFVGITSEIDGGNENKCYGNYLH